MKKGIYHYSPILQFDVGEIGNALVKQSSMAFKTDLLTPEALWAMGRIGNVALSPDGQQMVYTVSYYSVEQNKSRSMIYRYDFRQASSQLLTDSEAGLEL